MTYDLTNPLISSDVQHSDGGVPTEKIALGYETIVESWAAASGQPAPSSSSISGDITIPGQSADPIVTYDWTVEVPVDAATGVRSGTPQFGVLRVTRPVDSISPTILHDASTDAVLATVTVNLAPQGSSSTTATITLTNVQIVRITDLADGSAGSIPLETIELNYTKFQIDSGSNSACEAVSTLTAC